MKLRNFLIKLIDLYQRYLSNLKTLRPYSRSGCVFYPTCSEYTKLAIIKYGSLKGLYLGGRRLFRCHPWQKNHIDIP